MITFVHLLFSWNNMSLALKEAFYRDRLPNITNLVETTVVFAVVIYMQGFCIEIPDQIQHVQGQRVSNTVVFRLIRTVSCLSLFI